MAAPVGFRGRIQLGSLPKTLVPVDSMGVTVSIVRASHARSDPGRHRHPLASSLVIIQLASFRTSWVCGK